MPKFVDESDVIGQSVCMSRYPPERIDVGDVALRRDAVDDAASIAGAVSDNLEHLRPWMPWANEENATVEAQRARLESMTKNWDAGEDYEFMAERNGACIGVFGLHRRVGPGAIEIGYWLTEQMTGYGIATACTAALTKAGLDLDDVDRVEIHCDVANERSQKIPERLGYRLDRVEDDEIEAPGEIGRSMVWLYPA